ncbi:YggS family pyridoxal phosphate-dependent enzyme [Ningiella sp. W23]|uniref:YggS family pyridoxal phosphate-dependent enzyme n=1 Tax=Ningiella sp. W23 TaxID=3023715 RepID=UPI0037577938
MSTNIADNLMRVNQRIQDASAACNRDHNDIHLLAVSKTKPVSDVLLAYENGQRDFGENYVQEGVKKIQELAEFSDIVWHFIGPLQSNKSKFIAEYFDWMHSLDRFKIAKRLNDQRSAHQSPLNICIQVNIDNEETKAGVSEEDVEALIEQIQGLSRITCRGLMTIPKASDSKMQQRQSLEKMQDLFKRCQARFPDLDTLSMGMSNDLDLAIACGSTMVRVGTDIFGKRAQAPTKTKERHDF